MSIQYYFNLVEKFAIDVWEEKFDKNIINDNSCKILMLKSPRILIYFPYIQKIDTELIKYFLTQLKDNSIKIGVIVVLNQIVDKILTTIQHTYTIHTFGLSQVIDTSHAFYSKHTLVSDEDIENNKLLKKIDRKTLPKIYSSDYHIKLLLTAKKGNVVKVETSEVSGGMNRITYLQVI